MGSFLGFGRPDCLAKTFYGFSTGIEAGLVRLYFRRVKLRPGGPTRGPYHRSHVVGAGEATPRRRRLVVKLLSPTHPRSDFRARTCARYMFICLYWLRFARANLRGRLLTRTLSNP